MSPLWLLRLATWLSISAPPQLPETVRVASIGYAGGDPRAFGCDRDLCAFETLVRSAAGRGASIIVTPEYSMPQRDAEPRVQIGRRPSSVAAPIQAHFSALADSLDIHLAINLETEDAKGQLFNSLLVFDPRGMLAARHDKMELFEGERQTLEPGDTITTLQTPYGRFGLLICADLYTEPATHRALVEGGGAGEGVSLILFSAAWTVPVATRWQAAFAHDWGVYFVAANASLGDGSGSGIFDPKGRAIGHDGPLRSIRIADIPVAPISAAAGSHGAQ